MGKFVTSWCCIVLQHWTVQNKNKSNWKVPLRSNREQPKDIFTKTRLIIEVWYKSKTTIILMISMLIVLKPLHLYSSFVLFSNVFLHMSSCIPYLSSIYFITVIFNKYLSDVFIFFEDLHHPYILSSCYRIMLRYLLPWLQCIFTISNQCTLLH